MVDRFDTVRRRQRWLRHSNARAAHRYREYPGRAEVMDYDDLLTVEIANEKIDNSTFSNRKPTS